MGEMGEFWRAVKEDKRRRAHENPPHHRCWDWMIVSGSCHYAKNRSSFVTYRRVGRKVPSGVTGGDAFVAGIGSVELKVRSGKAKGSPVRTLVLYDVLHIPDAVCNGFCFDLLQVEGGSVSTKTGDFSATDGQGHPLWHGERFCGLSRLVLAGKPQGESYLEDIKKDGTLLALSMYIDMRRLAPP